MSFWEKLGTLTRDLAAQMMDEGLVLDAGIKIQLAVGFSLRGLK